MSISQLNLACIIDAIPIHWGGGRGIEDWANT